MRGSILPAFAGCERPGSVRKGAAVQLDISDLFVHPFYLFSGLVLGAIGVWYAMPRASRAPRELGAIIAAAGVGLVLLGLLLSTAREALPNVFFYAFAAISLGSALRVITHPRPVYAALFFVLTVVSGAGLFVLLSAEFLAFALVIIYAGAILITYLFVIMLATQAPTEADLDKAPVSDTVSRAPTGAVFAGFLLLATMTGLFNAGLSELPPAPEDHVKGDLERLPLKLKNAYVSAGFPAEIEVGQDIQRGTMINASPDANNALVWLDYETGIPFIKRYLMAYANELPVYRRDRFLREQSLVRHGQAQPMFALNESVEPLPPETLALFARSKGKPIVHTQGLKDGEAANANWVIVLSISDDVEVTNLEAVGFSLLAEHPLALELAGVILLMALIGAVVIARKHVELSDAETDAAAAAAGRAA